MRRFYKAIILAIFTIIIVPCSTFSYLMLRKNNISEIREIAKKINHLVIIADGNRRWARKNNLKEIQGHTVAFNKIAPRIITESFNLGIHTFTLWGFSTGNWKRNKKEIDNLMRCFITLCHNSLKIAKKYNARIIHLGRKDRFPTNLTNLLTKIEKITKNNNSHILNLALDYGGQDEILRACKTILEKNIEPNKLTPELFAKNLDTKDQIYPSPDLIIRPSGEQRISGFMPWQTLYTELLFIQKYFPEFDKSVLYNCIKNFGLRKRTFSK